MDYKTLMVMKLEGQVPFLECIHVVRNFEFY